MPATASRWLSGKCMQGAEMARQMKLLTKDASYCALTKALAVVGRCLTACSRRRCSLFSGKAAPSSACDVAAAACAHGIVVASSHDQGMVLMELTDSRSCHLQVIISLPCTMVSLSSALSYWRGANAAPDVATGWVGPPRSAAREPPPSLMRSGAVRRDSCCVRWLPLVAALPLPATAKCCCCAGCQLCCDCGCGGAPAQPSAGANRSPVGQSLSMVAVRSRPESACARSMSGAAFSSAAVLGQLLRLALLLAWRELQSIVQNTSESSYLQAHERQGVQLQKGVAHAPVCWQACKGETHSLVLVSKGSSFRFVIHVQQVPLAVVCFRRPAAAASRLRCGHATA